jgi:hypothetical protein
MNDMTLNEWDFPVDTYDLWASPTLADKKDIEVPQSMARAIVRTDTNQVLGVHGKKYKAIRHDDVVNSVFDAVRDANPSRDYNYKIEVFEDGKKLRGTIDFPDLIIEPSIGDHIHFQIVFFNSYDGSWAFGQQAQGLRQWCLNGCTSPDTIAKTVAKHTTNVNVQSSAAKIQVGLDAFFNSKDTYKDWMQHHITMEEAELFLKNTLCDVRTNTTEKKYNFKQLDALMGEWRHNARHVGNNKWALYNTMTAWATHTDESRSPAQTRRLRENQVARAVPQLAHV